MTATGMILGIDPMDADTNGLGDEPEEMRHCDGCGEDYNAFEESHVGHALDRRRKPTAEEAEAILTLVRGGWLNLVLTLDDEAV